MMEIKTPPLELTEGIPYIPVDDNSVVFTENHSIADILRYAIKCAGDSKEEIESILHVLL
jgi:hypothetical protein